MIITTVNKLFNNLFVSFQASVGNYMITEGKNKTYQLFNKIFFSNYIITSYTTITLIASLNPFICFWLGSEYTWPLFIEVVLVFNNYQRFIFHSVSVFRNSAGLFNPYSFFKYSGFVEGAINIICSVLFITLFNFNPILGIFLGTTLSTVLPSIIQPHALFKYYFGEQYLRDYWSKYLKYILVTIFNSALVLILCNLIVMNSFFIQFVVNIMISLIVFWGINLLLFKKTEECNYLITILVNLFKNQIKRNLIL